MPYFFIYLVDLIEFYKCSICKNIDDRIYFSDDRHYFSENYFPEIISQIEIYFPVVKIYFYIIIIFLITRLHR